MSLLLRHSANLAHRGAVQPSTSYGVAPSMLLQHRYVLIAVTGCPNSTHTVRELDLAATCRARRHRCVQAKALEDGGEGERGGIGTIANALAHAIVHLDTLPMRLATAPMVVAVTTSCLHGSHPPGSQAGADMRSRGRSRGRLRVLSCLGCRHQRCHEGGPGALQG